MADPKKKKPAKTYAEHIAEADAMIAEIEKLTAKSRAKSRAKTKSRRERMRVPDRFALSDSRLEEAYRKHSWAGHSPSSQMTWELTKSPRAVARHTEGLNRADDAKRGGFRMAPHPSRVSALTKALKKKK